MHNTIKSFLNIENKIKEKSIKLKRKNPPKIIAVSKTFDVSNIMPLINYGHKDFGENKVQEAVDKWTEIKKKNTINLHMLGKLQTNKVKSAISLFDYIHSLDSEKLALKISNEQKKLNKSLKIFIQVNVGNESQKSGIDQKEIIDFYTYCKKINLNIIGLMCIPPANSDPAQFFKEMKNLNLKIKLNELSMGMSGDYLTATENSSTYLRIGTSIFGNRISK